MFRSSWSKEVSVVSRSMVVIVSPVDLELFKRAEGDPRESVAELSKLGVTSVTVRPARAPSVLAVLSPRVGGAGGTCSEEVLGCVVPG